MVQLTERTSAYVAVSTIFVDNSKKNPNKHIKKYPL